MMAISMEPRAPQSVNLLYSSDSKERRSTYELS
jgi:hypothetical protein